MDEQLKIFLACIYGEADRSAPATWKAIASVILNRVATREWHRLRTPFDVIAKSGFDAYTHRNTPFVVALRALEKPDDIDSASRLGKLQAAVLPLYGGREPRTTDAVLYFSPMAQASLHRRNPARWPAKPRWHFDILEQVQIPGTENDDFNWFKYKE